METSKPRPKRVFPKCLVCRTNDASYFRYLDKGNDRGSYITVCEECLPVRILMGEKIGVCHDEWEPTRFWRMSGGEPAIKSDGLRREWELSLVKASK